MSIHVKWLLSMLYSATLQRALPGTDAGELTLFPVNGRPATILAFTGFQYWAVCCSRCQIVLWDRTPMSQD